MLGILRALLSAGAALVNVFAGGKRPSWEEAVPYVLQQLIPAVKEAVLYRGYNTKDKFDAWLQTVDKVTGEDAGALDVIKPMPADKEEEFFDHVIDAARVYGYSLLKVEGYYTA